MSDVLNGIIRGEIIAALFIACCAMGTYIGRGRR